MDYEDYEHVRSSTLGRAVVVAIDGPSGSGKSTVARQVAAALDLGYLDTGAMYRAAAWWVEDQNVDLSDPQAVTAAVTNMSLQVNPVAHAFRVLVGGTDVNAAIRQEHITSIVSTVSNIIPVRQILISQQRQIIAEAQQTGRGIVVEGRDITTVVAPDATVRILLTAAQDVRLNRRAREANGLGATVTVEIDDEQRDLVLGRDARDSQVTQFQEAAQGVHTIDTTEMSIRDAVDSVMYLIGQEVI